MEFHLAADAPNLSHVRIAQHPVTFHRVGDIDHPTGLGLQALRGLVCQLRQSLCVSDTNTDWDTCTAKYLGTNLSAQGVQPVDTRQVGECLINLKERCQPMDMSETRADSSFPLNTPWPWTSPCEGLSESNLSIPKSAVDRGQHSSLPSGIIRDRQFSAKSSHSM